MSIYGSVIPGSGCLAKTPGELSQTARQRLKWFDYYRSHGHNARLTGRYFGISPQTFYRWERRYDPGNLKSLEGAQAVLSLQEQYPRWGKSLPGVERRDKLVVLLRQGGWLVSTSMVGRILRHLKRRGVLWEPVRFVSAHRRRLARPYGVRKPKEYPIQGPGDLGQVDTLDNRPLPGVVLKHFTVREVTSRWDVVEVHTRATATTAAGFLEALQARMPFPVKAIPVEGGSEFMAPFEEACPRRGIGLFLLPPRSPKLNGAVERAHRPHVEAFYEVVDSDFTVADLHGKLLEWEVIYNTVRPHQARGYLTPQEFLQGYQQNHRKEVMCH